MSSVPLGQRPGGLTVLAVVNFILGGFGSLSLLFWLAILGILDAATAGELSRGSDGIPGKALLLLGLLLKVVEVALLIASGVGYLKLKWFLGRLLGSIYGLVGLGTTALTVAAKGGDFGMGDVITLVYPVMTLVLLNTVFKDDFFKS